MTIDETAKSVLSKFVPGFGSYLSQQKRRDDDVAVRKYLADRLQECKRDLQSALVPFLSSGRFEIITAGERLREAIDSVQSKIRSAVEGYSSWFDKSQIDEGKLKQVVDLDNDLVGVVDRLQSGIGALSKNDPDFAECLSLVANLKHRFSQRTEILARS